MSNFSEAQETLYQDILESFSRTADETGKLDATTFKGTIELYGLEFGDPIVDNIMIQININEDGTIDVAKLIDLLRGKKKKSDPNIKLTDAKNKDQSKKVLGLSEEVRSLFARYDTGYMNKDEFRNSLRHLGVEESLETERLLRQCHVSFRDLMLSLTHKPVEVKDVTNYEEDWVLVTKDYSPSEHVQNNNSCDRFVVHEEEDPSVASIIQQTDESNFETSYQVSTNQVQNRSNSDGPLTSAGFFTKDDGLVREQIYSCIRLLSKGILTVESFREQLQALDVTIPREVHLALIRHKRHGLVTFGEFVCAFEPYFDSVTKHTFGWNEETPVKEKTRPPTPPNIKKHKKHFKKHSNFLKGHGDIISWGKQNSSHPEEDRKQSIMDAKKDSQAFKTKRAFYNRDKNILSWDNNGNPIDEVRVGLQRIIDPNQIPGSIITWHGAPKEKKPRAHFQRSAYGSKVLYKPCPYAKEGNMVHAEDIADFTDEVGRQWARWLEKRDNHPSHLKSSVQIGSSNVHNTTHNTETKLNKPKTNVPESQKSHLGDGLIVKTNPDFIPGRRHRLDHIEDHFDSAGEFTVENNREKKEKKEGKRTGYPPQVTPWVESQNSKNDLFMMKTGKRGGYRKNDELLQSHLDVAYQPLKDSKV